MKEEAAEGVVLAGSSEGDILRVAPGDLAPGEDLPLEALSTEAMPPFCVRSAPMEEQVWASRASGDFLASSWGEKSDCLPVGLNTFPHKHAT